MTQYEWKTAGPKPPVDAQIFGEVVEQISGDLDGARPEDIVEVARPRRSPIHEMFEWNDAKGAELYRRQQARHFVGSLQIVRVEFSRGQTLSNRAFFSVATESRTGYVEQDRILGDRDLTKQVLDTMRRDLEYLLRKYGAVMTMGNYVPRLQAMVDEMRDQADTILLAATTRRPRTRERGSETPVLPAPAQ